MIRVPLISLLHPLRFLLVGVVALITCACTSQGNVQEAAPAARPDPLAAADQLLARGDYAAAAEAYTTLATTLPAHDAV